MSPLAVLCKFCGVVAGKPCRAVSRRGRPAVPYFYHVDRRRRLARILGQVEKYNAEFFR